MKLVMGAFLASPWATWAIAGLATAGVIVRPFAWPEYIWAVGGAVLLVALGSLSASDALSGITKGTDVYLFLTGMMMLSELARQEGLFDWLAARAAGLARGSATRLFTLVFVVGTIVTTFLSNDATAVVLTPAVAAMAKAARADKPLPYLFTCAFIANAASFVLPISNPANLVIYGSHMPPLLQWLPRYALPSALSILATYCVLRWSQRGDLRQEILANIEVPALSAAGKMTAFGIGATAVVLLVSSGFDIQLGLPTFLAGLGTAVLVLTRSRCGVFDILKNISWGVLPLVAGLFVLVESLEKTGVTRALSVLLQHLVQQSASLAAWASGVVLAVGCNLVNNLPAGLVAGRVAEMAHVPDHVRSAVLIGIDLGPNLSVTGSLATIPVAHRPAPRRPERKRLGLSQARCAGHAPGAFPRDRGRVHVRLNQFHGEQNNAERRLSLALSPYPDCGRAAGVGTADERGTAEVARKSLARQHYFLPADCGVPAGVVLVPAKSLAFHKEHWRNAMVGATRRLARRVRRGDGSAVRGQDRRRPVRRADDHGEHPDVAGCRPFRLVRHRAT